ncbi:MAG: hypothetical protein ACYS0E_20585 [Planctomycetota bacterium]|jgi:hypothetical protein
MRPLLAAFFVFLPLIGCGSDDEAKVAKPAKAPPPAAHEDPGLTEPMAAEFGAACLVPEDSSLFVSSLRLKEQWDLVSKSNAVAMLLELPTVQMALGALTASPQWAEFQQMRQQVPQVQAGLDVLADAFSQETFVCLDQRWPDFVTALGAAYFQTAMASMQGDNVATANALVAAVVDQADGLRLPSVLIGFRLADPDRARSLLDELAAQLKGSPIPLAQEEIGGGKFHTIRLEASMVPADIRRGYEQELSSRFVPPDRIRKLNAWIDTQTVAIAIGLRDDYLLLSVGADTAQLAALGGKASLAESQRFEPIRKVFKPGVLSLSYVCGGLTNSGKIPVDDVLALVDEGLAWLGELPSGLAERLRKDATGFVVDLNKGLPEERDELNISFLNKGVESYAFGAIAPQMDASRPLSILTSAGPAPLLAFASRSLSSKGSYERLAHWCGVAYGYFEDFAVPMMSKRDRAEFDQFEKTFLPAMRQMHETTANKLIPAVDACQSLFVMSGDGTMPTIPGLRATLIAPLRYPQPALVIGLNDAELLTAAFADYRKTINGLLAAMAKQEPELAGVQLPPPEARPFDGGTRYAYAVPLPPEFKLLPHAAVTKDHAVLAISEGHSTALLKQAPLPNNGVVDLSLPAGSAGWVDIAGLTKLVFDDAEIFVQLMIHEGEIDKQTSDLVRAHLPVARKVFGVFKSYTSRTWIEGDAAVTHSWLHMEDAKR